MVLVGLKIGCRTPLSSSDPGDGSSRLGVVLSPCVFCLLDPFGLDDPDERGETRSQRGRRLIFPTVVFTD